MPDSTHCNRRPAAPSSGQNVLRFAIVGLTSERAAVALRELIEAIVEGNTTLTAAFRPRGARVT
jgi:hypothetical protein